MKHLTVYFIIFLSYLVALLFVRKNRNNVCKTFNDYYTDRDQNENCYYNSDYKLTVPEIATKLGYPSQIYNVTTEDGYILTVFRIPYSPYDSHGNKSRKPVFLQHGMNLNSNSFVNVGRNSLGFVLSDSGYDVWLGNFRGTKYSSNHLQFSSDSRKFWDFSIDELVVYDLPVQIGLVTNITNQKAIYLGYSLGATAGFMFGSAFPEVALNKTKLIVGLAPVIYGHGVLAAAMLKYTWFFIRPAFQLLTNGEFFLRPSRKILEILCLPYPFQMKMCQLFDMVVQGYNFDQNNPETLPITLQNSYDSTSAEVPSQFLQIAFSKEFKRFDRGMTENMLRYQSPYPPIYNLSKINIPVYLIGAESDTLSTLDNLKRLAQDLPVATKVDDYHVIQDKSFNHIDILNGKDAKPFVYDVIVKFLEKHF